MNKMSQRTLTVFNFCIMVIIIIIIGSNYVSGQKPYDSKKQRCCKGTVQDLVTGQPTCCGPNIYDALTEQCCDDGSTVIARMEGNDTLTCCAGKAVVAGYNQKCCGGKLSEQPQVTSQRDTFGCCNEQIYIVQTQSCCNGVVSADFNQRLQCCNNAISYDSSESICCNGTVLQVPATISRYSYSCCGIKGYDRNSEVCDRDTDTIYQKPANDSCASAYSQVCGGKVLNPNQQCCNNEAYRAPSVWIDDGRGTGTGRMEVSAVECCASAKTLIQDPSKEACCDDVTVGILPIDKSSQKCCANRIYDTDVNICCKGTVQAGSALSMRCCESNGYNYNTQLCCGDQVYEKSDGYDSCCSPK